MSQQQNETLLPIRQQPRIEEEFSVALFAFASAVGNVITLNHTLVDLGFQTDELAGQSLLVLQSFANNSAWAGQVLHIVSNTGATITVEETVEGTNRWEEFTYNLGVNGAGAVTERFAVSQRGVAPGHRVTWAANLKGDGTYSLNCAEHEVYQLTEWFGAIEQTPTPDPKHDIAELMAVGSPNAPGRHTYIHNRTSYEASWPLSVIVAKRLFLGLGWVADGASAWDAGGAEAITMDIYPGEQTIEVASTAGFAAGDYVEVSTRVNAAAAVIDGEIRKVVHVQANTYLTVDKPFRRCHPIAGLNVNKVDTTCYNYGSALSMASTNAVMHRMYVGNQYGFTVPTFTVGLLSKGNIEPTPQAEDLFTTYRGHIVSEISLKSDTNGELKAEMSSKGLYANRDELTAPTLSTALFYDNLSAALKPFHFSRSYVQLDDVTWHYTEDFDLTISREIDTKYAHWRGTIERGLMGGHSPLLHSQGAVKFKASFNIPMHNKHLWDLVKARGKLDFEFNFTILRSATFTEAMNVKAYNCVLESAPIEISSSPSIQQASAGSPDHVEMSVSDKIPYY